VFDRLSRSKPDAPGQKALKRRVALPDAEDRAKTYRGLRWPDGSRCVDRAADDGRLERSVREMMIGTCYSGFEKGVLVMDNLKTHGLSFTHEAFRSTLARRLAEPLED